MCFQANVKPVCVVGEPLIFECTLLNPLRVDLVFTNVTLNAQLSPAGDAAVSASLSQVENHHTSFDAGSGLTVAIIDTLAIEAQVFCRVSVCKNETVQKIAYLILLQKSARVQFRIMPLVSGQINIRGISFTIDGVRVRF